MPRRPPGRVTADIFGQRIEHDVDAVLERLLEHRAKQGVVADNDRAQAGLADGDNLCNGSQPGKVDQAVHGVRRSFDEDHRIRPLASAASAAARAVGGIDAVGKAFGQHTEWVEGAGEQGFSA